MASTSRSSPSSERARAPLGVVDALAQLSFRVQEVLSDVAAAHDMSLVQLRLFGILRGREPAMLELAAFLRLDKSSVTGLVARAERRGLVERSGREDDRRAVHVALTASGKKLVAVVEKQVGRELAKVVAHLTEAETKQLVSLASRVIEGATPGS